MKEHLIEYNEETLLFDVYKQGENKNEYWYMCELSGSELLTLLRHSNMNNPIVFNTDMNVLDIID